MLCYFLKRWIDQIGIFKTFVSLIYKQLFFCQMTYISWCSWMTRLPDGLLDLQCCRVSRSERCAIARLETRYGSPIACVWEILWRGFPASPYWSINTDTVYSRTSHRLTLGGFFLQKEVIYSVLGLASRNVSLHPTNSWITSKKCKVSHLWTWNCIRKLLHTSHIIKLI